MTGWRRRLAALRAEEHSNANSAGSADSDDTVAPRTPIGTNGAIGIKMEVAERAAALLRTAEETAAVLAAPDPDLAHERAEISAALAAEARGDFGRPVAEGRHRAALAGFLAAGLQRPPGWSDPASVPPPGAWCSCCGRLHRSGGWWWREAAAPKGWRCTTCHPPVHLSPNDVVDVRT